jgi:hypothetical protein
MANFRPIWSHRKRTKKSCENRLKPWIVNNPDQQVFNKFPSTVVGPFADLPFPDVTEVSYHFVSKYLFKIKYSKFIFIYILFIFIYIYLYLFIFIYIYLYLFIFIYIYLYLFIFIYIYLYLIYI